MELVHTAASVLQCVHEKRVAARAHPSDNFTRRAGVHVGRLSALTPCMTICWDDR